MRLFVAVGFDRSERKGRYLLLKRQLDYTFVVIVCFIDHLAVCQNLKLFGHSGREGIGLQIQWPVTYRGAVADLLDTALQRFAIQVAVENDSHVLDISRRRKTIRNFGIQGDRAAVITAFVGGAVDTVS